MIISTFMYTYGSGGGGKDDERVDEGAVVVMMRAREGRYHCTHGVFKTPSAPLPSVRLWRLLHTGPAHRGVAEQGGVEGRSALGPCWVTLALYWVEATTCGAARGRTLIAPAELFALKNWDYYCCSQGVKGPNKGSRGSSTTYW